MIQGVKPNRKTNTTYSLQPTATPYVMFMVDRLVNGFIIGHKWKQYVKPGEGAQENKNFWGQNLINTNPRVEFCFKNSIWNVDIQKLK